MINENIIYCCICSQKLIDASNKVVCTGCFAFTCKSCVQNLEKSSCPVCRMKFTTIIRHRVRNIYYVNNIWDDPPISEESDDNSLQSSNWQEIPVYSGLHVIPTQQEIQVNSNSLEQSNSISYPVYLDQSLFNLDQKLIDIKQSIESIDDTIRPSFYVINLSKYAKTDEFLYKSCDYLFKIAPEFKKFGFLFVSLIHGTIFYHVHIDFAEFDVGLLVKSIINNYDPKPTTRVISHVSNEDINGMLYIDEEYRDADLKVFLDLFLVTLRDYKLVPDDFNIIF